jgi:hypothetical protein
MRRHPLFPSFTFAPVKVDTNIATVTSVANALNVLSPGAAAIASSGVEVVQY